MATENGNDMDSNLSELTADIVSAYVGNNAVPADKLPEFISAVYGALSAATGQAAPKTEQPLSPAVPIKRSVTDDEITCLFCGKAFKSLKRHLGAEHGMTPDEYRAKWRLNHDYPMTAPGYSNIRSAMAKKIGLGQMRRSR